MATSSWCQDTLCWPRRWIWKKRVAGQMADPGLSIYHLILPGKTWEICPGSNFQERYWGKLFQSGQFSWSSLDHQGPNISPENPSWKSWKICPWSNIEEILRKLGEFFWSMTQHVSNLFLWIRILDCAGNVAVWNYPGSIPALWAKRNCPASGRRELD